MRAPTVAIVIPCYNTSAACAAVVSQALAVTPFVLAVNDGSTDDTGMHLDRSGARALHLGRNGGKGVALRAGIAEVLKDATVRSASRSTISSRSTATASMIPPTCRG